MTEIRVYNRDAVRFQVIFAGAVILSLTVAIFAGLKLEAVENCIIIPKALQANNSFFETVISICFWDTAALWFLSLPFSKGMTVVASSIVFFFRGMVIGNASRVFFTNSVSGIAITIFVSYMAITLLMLVYDALLNGTDERLHPSVRLLSCLVATGACAIIRIIPMMLIE